MSDRVLSLFEGYGIEIELVLVDAETLDVRPLVDRVFRDATGGEEWVDDVDDGPIGWSNELVTHVVELKTNGPVPGWEGVADAFEASVARLSSLLAPLGARLMPTGMHPWMDPARETRLWPHGHTEVYRAYDRLFDCRRHGWANLQSTHLNLPFADEDEFGRLMAAVRLVLPLIPALAASSPLVEGRATGLLDNRLDTYRSNSARVPAMTADVVPEPVFGYDEYRRTVFERIDAELEAQGAGPELLRQPFTNARGAIARFDRMAIEIRLVDTQECPRADLALAATLSAVVRGLVEERWCSGTDQRAWSTASLAGQLRTAIAEGPGAELVTPALATAFGVRAGTVGTLGELWRTLVPALDVPAELEPSLDVVLRSGTLAQRILAALGSAPDRPRQRAVYGELCDCLLAGRSFQA